MDFLLTCYCRHINNRALQRRIEHACAVGGLPCPVICTPTELMSSGLRKRTKSWMKSTATGKNTPAPSAMTSTKFLRTFAETRHNSKRKAGTSSLPLPTNLSPPPPCAKSRPSRERTCHANAHRRRRARERDAHVGGQARPHRQPMWPACVGSTDSIRSHVVFWHQGPAEPWCPMRITKPRGWSRARSRRSHALKTQAPNLGVAGVHHATAGNARSQCVQRPRLCAG